MYVFRSGRFYFSVTGCSERAQNGDVLQAFTLSNRNAQTVVLLPPVSLSSSPQILPLPEHLFHWYVCFCKVQNKVFLEQEGAYLSQDNFVFLGMMSALQSNPKMSQASWRVLWQKRRDCWVYLLIFPYWHIWELIDNFETSSFVSIGVLKQGSAPKSSLW